MIILKTILLYYYTTHVLDENPHAPLKKKNVLEVS